MKTCLVTVATLMALAGAAPAQDLPPPPARPAIDPARFLPPMNEAPAVRQRGALPPLNAAPPAHGPTSLPVLPSDPPAARPITTEEHPAPKREEAPAPASAQSPLVTAEIIATDTANVGQPLTHDIVVRNHGKTPVHQVRVQQELAPGVRYLGGEPRADFPNDKLSWNLGSLEAGTEKRIKVNVLSTSEGDLQMRATVTFATTCTAVTRVTRPRLAVAITGPEAALIGETVAFQIRLTNAGSGPIHKLLLQDRLPPGLEHPQGTTLEAEVAGLAPGESRTVTLKTTAARIGRYIHEVHAFADGAQAAIQQAGGVRNPDLEASAKTEIRVVEPALQVKLTGPRTCLVKCDSVLSVDLSNPGTAATRNIRVAARIPDGMEFVALSDEGRFDPATHTASWGLPTLEPGAQRVLTLKVRGVALGESTGIAMAQADGNLSAKAELPLKIEGVPALSLELIDLDDPAPVGSDATYEVRVLNRGTCPCTGIQIVTTMPEGMELREASAPVPYKVVGQQVQFAPCAKLETKADLVFRLKVRSTVAGDVRFRVQMTCDQLQQPVLKEEASRFYKP